MSDPRADLGDAIAVAVEARGEGAASFYDSAKIERRRR